MVEAEAETPAAPEPTSEEEIFAAAGFELTDGTWSKCGDPGTASYAPGSIERQGDFNGDGHEDALIFEGGTYCFGMTGNGYTLLTNLPDSGWTIIDERIGLPQFLDTTGTDGWPDIQVGGPGFCFPVIRWNGSEYAVDRNEYEGKPCEM